MIQITPLNQMTLSEQRYILNKLGANIGELPAHLLTKAIEDNKHLIIEDELNAKSPNIEEEPVITSTKTTRVKRTKEGK
jgi:hypothetical protein